MDIRTDLSDLRKVITGAELGRKESKGGTSIKTLLTDSFYAGAERVTLYLKSDCINIITFTELNDKPFYNMSFSLTEREASRIAMLFVKL